MGRKLFGIRHSLGLDQEDPARKKEREQAEKASRQEEETRPPSDKWMKEQRKKNQ